MAKSEEIEIGIWLHMKDTKESLDPYSTEYLRN